MVLSRRVRNEAPAAQRAQSAPTSNALAASEARVKSLQADFVARPAALDAIHGSTSRRFTAPLRMASSGGRWLVRGFWAWITLKPGSRSRRIARKLLQRAVRFVLARPLAARMLGTAFDHFPKVKSRIFFHFPTEPGLGLSVGSAGSLDALLSERERFVHARLKAALEKRPS